MSLQIERCQEKECKSRKQDKIEKFMREFYFDFSVIETDVEGKRHINHVASYQLESQRTIIQKLQLDIH